MRRETNPNDRRALAPPIRASIITAAALALTAGAAHAQTWTEAGDAGEFPIGGYQDTSGIGPITAIDGTLDWTIGDHVDAYSIVVTDPQNFMASTDPSRGGFFIDDGQLEDDSRLYLFTTDGQLVYANDDDAGAGSLESTVMNPAGYPGALFNNPGNVVEGVKYILAVTYFDNNLLDAAGAPLVDFFADFDALHGLNPNAGAADSWENPGDFDDSWTYRIAIRGAEFCVPTPASGGLFATAGLLAARRRRRA